jgi:predicted RNase H-like HicB family nuclease
MKQRFSASIWQEDEWFIAQCVQVDVASQGATEDEALENLRDALELHFSQPVATLVPHVRDIAFAAHSKERPQAGLPDCT